MTDFHPLFDRSPNAYVVLDRDLRLVAMNQAYLQVTARSREEILGRTMFEAFPSDETSDSHRHLMASLLRVLDTGQADELAHIRYDIPNADGTFDVEFWSATHTPILDDNGDVELILQHTVNITQLRQGERGRDEAGIVERARLVERRARDMSDEVERMRRLLEQSPGFMAILQGPTHRYLMANPAYHRLLGNRDFIGKTVAEAVPELVEQGFLALLDEVYTAGETYIGQRDKVIFHDSDAAPRETYLEFIFQPIRAGDGSAWGIFIQGHDVTEQVEAEQRQHLLINELNHRVKNTLAIVQGLAQQTFGKQGDSRFEIFSARLAALAGTHNLLTESTWESAGLRELIYSSLEATAGLDIARCKLSGPSITLPPTLALSLAMIMHELSTNAIKYGALSNREGAVSVNWQVERADETARLEIDWAETNGPPVAASVHEGFGARLIRRGLAGLGSTRLEFRPEGVHCHVEATL